jgi:hypothetical protein
MDSEIFHTEDYQLACALVMDNIAYRTEHRLMGLNFTYVQSTKRVMEVMVAVKVEK